MSYRHEQIGRGLIAILVVLTIAMLFAGYALDETLPYAVAVILFLATLAFAKLTIEVEPEGLRWKMTFGFPGAFVPFSEIESASIVPVSFWYGIGIHLTLRGWVWNVALGRGVQIVRRNALPIVLGTDDADGLLAAIERARAA